MKLVSLLLTFSMVSLGGLTRAGAAPATIPLVNHGDEWRYHKGTSAAQSDWKTVADGGLDGTWLTGNGGIGYASNAAEEANLQTILSDMRNSYTTVFMRRRFEITGDVSAMRLVLRMDWDDGYIAWLDGNFLTAANYNAAPTEPAHTGTASSDHESSLGSGGNAPVSNDLGLAGARLPVGTHTLSIIGLNGDAPSSDFIMVADLFLEEDDSVPPGLTAPPLISTSTTWYTTNSPVLVPADIEIAAGACLTIEPGVTVTFAQGVTMTVRGCLFADGTEAEPIAFTRTATAATWDRILFLDAGDSRLRHCSVEFANCVGDHKDYYDPDNNLNTPPPSRNYFQAIVAVSSHVDIENCLFTNLPNSSATAEGDAIAVISDDPDVPGDGSARIIDSRFIGIGQGIHTRNSHVWVEGCFFTGHHGDNDDIDLYGESIPPSYIVNNMLVNPASDDVFNPTRCSAIIIGNVFSGAPDACVVLRDVGTPVMINNLVYNCGSYGISMQNRNDAWLVNNTVVDCGQAIEFRDHEGRHNDPYYLVPGSGRATVINCIVWDSGTSFNLGGSQTAEPSVARVFNCLIQGGQAGATVSGGSTLIWGTGNIDVNPAFVNLAGNDYHLAAGSPCIDSGSNILSVTITITNLAGVVTNWTVNVPRDLDGVGRPLDGDNNGSSAVDIGAYEFLHPGADSNGDGIPDTWYTAYGLNAAELGIGALNPDNDPHTTAEEWTADTDPTDPASHLRIVSLLKNSSATVGFESSSNRIYSLLQSVDFSGAPVWTPVAGQTAVPGTGGSQALTDSSAIASKLYQIEVQVP